VRVGALLLAVAASVGACSSGGSSVGRAAPTATVRAGQSLGWHTMAYLASNRASVTIQVGTTASAALVVGEPTDVDVRVQFIGRPVWVAVVPQHATVRQRDGRGRLFVSTVGCRRDRECTRKPLYVLTGEPIPRVPPGGIPTRDGLRLHIDSHGVEPGRYDFTLAVRYPSSDRRAATLDVSDTLHIRIDVSSTGPPPQRCSPADLHRPSAALTAAHALTDTISLEGGNTRLDPPPAGFTPRVSADRARERLGATFAQGGGGTATLVLATLSESFPRTAGHVAVPVDRQHFPPQNLETRPLIHKEVAWVRYVQHVAVNSNSISRGPVAPGAKRPTIAADACFFSDGLSAIDATTGKDLGSGGGSASPDPIKF